MEKIPLIVETFTRKDKSITICYPNVRYAKENNLLLKKHGITHEMIVYNMNICGFDVVSYGEHNGVDTKIKAKCSNVDCENTNEKRYTTLITNERYPLCQACQPIIIGINRNNKRPIVAIKGEERFEFESVNEAARQLNITHQNVYNYLKKRCTTSFWLPF